jgi:moderate conductance mechanosensitive channel
MLKSMWRRLFNGPENWQLALAVVVPTAVLALLAARAARVAATAAMRNLLRDTVVISSPLVRAPLRLIGFVAFTLVFAVLLFPAFEVAGLSPRTGIHLRELTEWTFDSGLKVLLILAVAIAIVRVIGVGVQRFEHDVNFGTGLDALERAKRAKTLGSVLSSMTTVVVLAVAFLMILDQLGVNIGPALTATGILGVALGFGAQTLVRDLIGGFFLIWENQVRVGDVVAMNGIGGLVEAINLRTTVLRDEEGTVHVIPNGAVTTLANRSIQFSYYVISVPLAYNEDPDRVAGLLKKIADEVRADDAFRPFILEPLEVIGVDAFEEHALRLKVRIKTAPLKQWYVGRELRRRMHRAFRDAGIQFWSAQKTATVSNPPEPPR